MKFYVEFNYSFMIVSCASKSFLYSFYCILDAQLKLYVNIKDVNLKYRCFVFYISFCTTSLSSLDYNEK